MCCQCVAVFISFVTCFVLSLFVFLCAGRPTHIWHTLRAEKPWAPQLFALLQLRRADPWQTTERLHAALLYGAAVSAPSPFA
jgi:hypothetical protein